MALFFLLRITMMTSFVRIIKYNPETENLRVTYESGIILNFKGVPGHIYKEMTESYWKGTFLSQRIKGRYAYEQIS